MDFNANKQLSLKWILKRCLLANLHRTQDYFISAYNWLAKPNTKGEMLSFRVQLFPWQIQSLHGSRWGGIKALWTFSATFSCFFFSFLLYFFFVLTAFVLFCSLVGYLPVLLVVRSLSQSFAPCSRGMGILCVPPIYSISMVPASWIFCSI